MAIGFKHGSSGGEPLGITVVSSSTKPTDPKENTIWVNDSYNYSMGSWSFSPDEPHRVSKKRNLIVYPYLYSSRTVNGVTFTVDDSTGNKGKVTVNGTNTSSGNIVFRLSDKGIGQREMLLQPGTYYLSGNCESTSTTTHRLLLVYTYNDWANTSTVYETTDNGKFTLNKVAKARVSIQVSGGQTVNNAIYQPMITKDSKGTVYEMGNATGQIWIKTGTGGTISMDATKGKNETIVTPITAYEYFTNSGWVKKTAEVYQYGAWKALEDPSAPVTPEAPWDGYYFNNGNQYTGVTGGWSGASSGSSSHLVGDTLAVSAPTSSSSAIVYTVNTVDLTNVTKLWFDSPNGSNGYSSGYLCVSSTQSFATNDLKASVTIRAGRGSLDVSRLSGSYYLVLAAANQSYADISAIWKE